MAEGAKVLVRFACMWMEAKIGFEELLASLSSFHAGLYHTATYYGILDFFGYILFIHSKEIVRIGWLPKPYTYTLPSMSHSHSIFCLYKHVLFLQLEYIELTGEQQQHAYRENQTSR